MCTFDPKMAPGTMAPNLTNKQREEYLAQERVFIEEILEDTDDCKWIFQALIELSLLEAELKGSISAEPKEKVREHIQKLIELDPLRKGRWVDLENRVDPM